MSYSLLLSNAYSPRFKKELWTLRAEERERKGRCFAGMILDTTFDPSSEADEHNSLSQTKFDAEGDVGSLATTSSASVTKIHKRTYRFMRSPTYATTEYPVSLKFYDFSPLTRRTEI